MQLWRVVFVLISTAVIATSADLSSRRANEQDVSTIEGIITASYESLSGPPGKRRDWARYRSLCDPDVRLVSASGDSKTGKAKIIRWTLQKYIHDVDGYLVGTGFVDKKLACVPKRYGNVATVLCGFEGREQSTLVERGVAIYQIYNDGSRWWITSVIWDRESPGNPIPFELEK